ncbi:MULTISPECIES: formate--tetrahydrofolate ligase [Lysinibacillus]|jgi:formate--tetrahydrofolate ligase|uniref:formate--tetrahydrofolate ligase n=1 Tax=Lysinibacillus TaxID=400634 RepID=UPI000884DFA4|nr:MULTISPECIES: formate--tetrahydrofolate ligase [unclassified Lysinibacillus]MEE3808698.1 formate--tetrahydrofolate ligase [Lysinibacillus fusiformis]WCH49339.1 formate--tetrahydrofolate ligase [Lysinibacillus sp. OF-1]SCY21514.1 Formate-tetrahydrofolate ligase [Lysinibacillus sp. SG9]SDB09903.1 Formate-tetrahydrofolate ligase [Lysinibacillus sp. TC-37]SFS45587.1 Formate-tetrahydrofolate ligase [Lysinibacillus sp. SG55]
MTTKNQPLSDLEIASQAVIKPITEIANAAGIPEDALEQYGRYKAKIDPLKITAQGEDAKVVLVSAISPTPAGEGKSTVTVGLADALHQLNKKVMVALREPSLGPVMGVKGGATGGGYAQVVPMEDINLHFTGDLHAITTANNALSAFIDNHIHQGNALNIDPRRIIWKRVMDLNDRALRKVVVGLGGPVQGMPREDGFDITVASEIMAVFCLATSIEDLRERIASIVVGYTFEREPVFVRDLQVEGALTLLLKDAFKPNLVQTLEGTPAIIHGGPFANIAHGCNSIMATQTARKLADIVVTEAGFGSDLGAEKFMNIKARKAGFKPSAVVIVATIRALKMHGGVPKTALVDENVNALLQGIENLAKHVDTVRTFGVEPIIALNRFITDSEAELEAVLNWCQENQVRIARTNVWEEGGKGGLALAEQVLAVLEEENNFSPLYDVTESIEEKVRTIVQKVYGGKDVQFTDQAKKQIAQIEKFGWDSLPVCMAKTQYSLSDQPSLLGRPEGFTITIREVIPKLGAGFLVCLTGDIMTMPGLPKTPAALRMNVDNEGHAVGLF